MAAPTYRDVLTFKRSVEKVSKEAGKSFEKLAAKVDFTDWALAADQLREIVEIIVRKYGLAASEIGAQWYEFCRSLEFGSGYRAIIGDVDANQTRRGVDAEVDKLFSGEAGTGELVSSLTMLVSDSVYEQSRDTVLNNVELEHKQALSQGNRRLAEKCGYSRVTTGDACAFCVLLASRGFAYHSERAALKDKSGDSYHKHCKCVAVPFARAGEISGYGETLSDHESKYIAADNLRRSKDYPDDLANRIADAKRNHDGKWTPLNETLIIMRYQNEGLS